MLAFFAITCAAVVVIYVIVVPSLGDSLRDQRLKDLAAGAQSSAAPLTRAAAAGAGRPDALTTVRRAAVGANARVTLLGVSASGAQPAPYPIADSAPSSGGSANGGGLRFGVAVTAARSGRAATAIENGTAGPVGEAALPLRVQGRTVGVAVYSTSLADVDRSVALIRNRILLGGAIALVLALLAGYLIARALSLRVKRLEQAAQRVTQGDYSARFEADSEDELGQLAGALNAMQRQLAQLDSARERFIAIASHELRTPIFSVGGFLELIQDEDLDEETRMQFVGQVREQVERLGKLATRLLDLSRLEAGGLDLHPEQADLSLIARTVTSEFVPALASHSSHLRLRLAEEPLPVVCDPERVAQIMRILIDNAIIHTPPGTNIVVTAQRSGPEARLSVRDFGPGVDPRLADRIFEPFYTSDGVQGSGLGLAIAHELAERMSGALTVESAPGRTVFTLHLVS